MSEAQPMLHGIKVVDLTTVVFGPYCTQNLADLGAEVTKVEAPPGGDMLRWSAASARNPGFAPMFMAFNHNKRSIVLDLKDEADVAVMRGLVAEADVLVANVRDKALARLGLDYAAVKAIRPDIIYVHCVGFGQDGPYADRPAYDDVIQAASGATSLLPRVDGNPQPRFMPTLVADKVAGLHATYATLAALFHRERTGEGQYVEVPMLETFSHFLLSEHMGGLTFDPPNAPPGYHRQFEPYRQPFPTADGYVSLTPNNNEAWDKIFALLGDPGFLDDPRFADAPSRMANMEAMYRRIAELSPRLTSAELIEGCAAAQIPAQLARDLADMTNDPHLQAVGFFRRREHPSEGPWLELAPPVKFGGYRRREPTQPPALDQDGPAIRAKLAGDD